jgi:hypothetical protein
MNRNPIVRTKTVETATDRKAWNRPEVTHLRAGAAENTPGVSIADGPLETIGS